MLETILNFFLNLEWLKILPILIGGMAGYVYVVQEYRKKKDAATLIVLQIVELQDKIVEFREYITNSDINDKKVYELLPFMKINYWEKYKYMFVNKIDNRSYDVFDKFYQCGSDSRTTKCSQKFNLNAREIPRFYKRWDESRR